MQCKKDNTELVGYQADTYPYESGYECLKCDRRWSNLQIYRAKMWRSSEEKAKVGADGIIFN